MSGFSSCYNSLPEAVLLTASTELTGANPFVATFTNEENLKSVIYSCTLNSEDKTILSCNLNPSSSRDDLTYTLSSFTDGTVTLTLASEQTTLTILTGVTIDLDSSLQANQKVNTADNTRNKFLVLIREGSSPSIYSEKNDARVISCTPQSDSPTLLECSTDYMTESKEYQIYYKNICGEFKELLKVTNEINEVIIQSLTINGKEGCSINADNFKEIVFTTSADSKGDITSAVFVISDETRTTITYSCQAVPDTTNYKCTTDNEITPGNYALESVNNATPRIAADVTYPQIIYKIDNTLSDSQIKSQDISSFNVLLASETTTTPKFFINDNEITGCVESAKPTITCTVPEDLVQQDGSYTVMYEDVCGGKSSTGITLDSTTKITVINLSLDGQCKTELTQITFSVNSAPAGIATLNLQGPESITSPCTITDLAASCTITLSTKGTYTIESIVSSNTAETFVLPADINSLIYDPATNSLAAEGQTNDQTIDASQSKTTFTVVLDGEDKAAPIIYLIMTNQKLSNVLEQKPL